MKHGLLYPQPDWIRELSGSWDSAREFTDIMALLHRVAYANVVHGGGPFAAALTHADGRIVELNVNLVVPCNDCGAHAEGVTLHNAQRLLAQAGTPVRDLHSFYLFSTGMPCVGCAGRIWLFRPARVYASVSKELIEANSPFSEGPVGKDFWPRARSERGIELIENFGFGSGEAALRPFRAFTQALSEGKTDSYLERKH